MNPQTRRPGFAAALLLVSLVLLLTSTPATAQTTRPQADKSPNPGSTCVFGEEFVAFCQHEDGGEGYLGFGSTGVHGQHQSGTNGYLGGFYGAYGIHINLNFGSLGGPDYGAYGQNANGNQGYLGGISYGAYGQNANGHVGSLGGSNYGAYGAHDNGNVGSLGGSNYGAYGQNANGNYGLLGSISYGAYGTHDNSNVGYLGGPDYGAYGQHANGNYAYLGGEFFAVRGQHEDSGNKGYLGTSQYGVYGFAPAGDHAGYFIGRVHVNGTLSKSGGSFLIDHPLNPENQYLAHSFVESPDMMNVYNGNVTTDAQGYVTVTLPSYFEALNRDFRYQLTVVGQFAQAIVAEEIQGNQFVIRTDEPNVKVSWQVTGIRQDPWAEQNRLVVEQVKPVEERGSYLHPALYGQPQERSVEWARDPEGMREIKEMPRRMEAERQRMEQQRLR